MGLSDLNPHILVGLTDTMGYLGLGNVAGTTQDLIVDLINRGSKIIESYCNRTFAAFTYTEEIDVNDEFMDTLILKQYPIISVVALTDYTTVVESNYYVVYADDGIVKLSSLYESLYGYNKYFTQGYQYAKITYRAGYEAMPQDLGQACIELVQFLYNERTDTGFESEKIGDYSYRRRGRDPGRAREVNIMASLPMSAQLTLSNYRKRNVRL